MYLLWCQTLYSCSLIPPRVTAAAPTSRHCTLLQMPGWFQSDTGFKINSVCGLKVFLTDWKLQIVCDDLILILTFKFRTATLKTNKLINKSWMQAVFYIIYAINTMTTCCQSEDSLHTFTGYTGHSCVISVYSVSSLQKHTYKWACKMFTVRTLYTVFQEIHCIKLCSGFG